MCAYKTSPIVWTLSLKVIDTTSTILKSFITFQGTVTLALPCPHQSLSLLQLDRTSGLWGVSLRPLVSASLLRLVPRTAHILRGPTQAQAKGPDGESGLLLVYCKTLKDSCSLRAGMRLDHHLQVQTRSLCHWKEKWLVFHQNQPL